MNFALNFHVSARIMALQFGYRLAFLAVFGVLVFSKLLHRGVTDGHIIKFMGNC